MQNVFLHGGWRCGSTYVWSKFRILPGVTAFYEPFSEKTAKYNAERIARDRPTAWDSRHPPLDLPYASEYLPLIADVGVPLYKDRFAMRRHFVARKQPLEEAEYLRSLIRHAADKSNRAVLGFSRSLGRVGAIKRHFDGCHVVLMRDPVQQWLSSRSYRVRDENPYFELCQFMILCLAPAGSLAAKAAAWLRLPTLPSGGVEQQYKFLRSHFRRLDDELSYKVFVAVYILSYVAALPEADLLIDMDLLNASPSYATVIAGAIHARTGLDVDFSDCSLPSHDIGCVDLDFPHLHECVAEWLLARDLERTQYLDHSSRTLMWSFIMNRLDSALLPAARGKLQAPHGKVHSAVANAASGNFGRRLRSLFGM